MLRRFLPQQEGFFELFQKSVDILATAAIEFHAMLNDLSNHQQYVYTIAAYEEDGDKVTHDTFKLLHKTFITPFDRHDIHRLTSRLDDTLDSINRCAQRFSFYQLKTVPNELIQLAKNSMQASLLLKEAIYRLNSLKKSAEILHFCEGIDGIESEAHTAVIAGEKDLFDHEDDFKRFFKLKETYSRTKEVINGYQDVANIIKGIVLEYS
ncbi:MAG: DUF47 domain-containing protein [Gammaproteobacteria bacterium]